MVRRSQQKKQRTPPPELTSLRVDKWLWAARFFKHRNVASEACRAGHVKLLPPPPEEGHGDNPQGDSVKSARVVRAGDWLSVRTPGGLKVVKVLALSEKRGPAVVARTLYEDHSPAPPKKPAIRLRSEEEPPRPLTPRERARAVLAALRGQPSGREAGMGRPTKRDRRLLDRNR